MSEQDSPGSAVDCADTNSSGGEVARQTSITIIADEDLAEDSNSGGKRRKDALKTVRSCVERIANLDDQLAIGFCRQLGGDVAAGFNKWQVVFEDRAWGRTREFEADWESHGCEAWNDPRVEHNHRTCQRCHVVDAPKARDQRIALWSDILLVLGEQDYLDRLVETARRKNTRVVDLRGVRENSTLSQFEPTKSDQVANTMNPEREYEPGTTEKGTVADWKHETVERAFADDGSIRDPAQLAAQKRDDDEEDDFEDGNGVGSTEFTTK